jgi:predicted alternative tryptophan synthase beta-subunit
LPARPFGESRQIYNLKAGEYKYDVFKNKASLGPVIDVYRIGLWIISYSQYGWHADPLKYDGIKHYGDE